MFDFLGRPHLDTDQETFKLSVFLPFLVLYLAILVLFLLLSHYTPIQQGIGWIGIVIYFFVYFVVEPILRQFTVRVEIHMLVIEVYLFTTYFIAVLFPASPYVHLFYTLPIFSAALSFGLLGSMLTVMASFLLEALRYGDLFNLALPDFDIILPDMLPLFILALLLGFTVQLSNRHRERLLDRLSRHNDFQETLIATVPVGIIIATEEAEIKRINQKAESMLEMSQQDLIESDARDLFEVDGEKLQLRPRRSEASLQSEGGSIPVDVAIESVVFEGVRSDRWIIALSDLRPIKELQEKAERRRRLVALGEMGAGLAHEIRNPLGSLSGFISLLKKRVDEKSDLQPLIEKIRESYRKIDDLIGEFVQYVYEPSETYTTFSLEKLLEKEIQNQELHEGIDLEYQSDLTENMIYGDPDRLSLALRNLLRNAKESIQDSGRIIVSLTEYDEEYEIMIEDSGVGISPDRQERIFDPFITFKDEGLGLGLSMVHRIITEEFQGTIEVSSETGKGTTFTITIPKRIEDR